MKIALVTDAWEPQVNGVVRTLKSTRRELFSLGHEMEIISPLEFSTIPCPTYPEIRLSLLPRAKLTRRIEAFKPDALHIATEGPLGMAARAWALRHNFPFTTAYHTRFPEYIKPRFGLPLSWSYAYLRRFHGASRAVMVPTPVVKQDLEQWGFHNVRLWSRGVDLKVFTPEGPKSIHTKRPVFLYVGRAAIEKNIEAFLKLDLPGSKWVAADGPSLPTLKRKYPDANYVGVLNAPELSALYRSADVFVFPSKTDTFGLVLLEALASGTPVASYPVTGPVDVIGTSGAGAMHEDLGTACLQALELSRSAARQHAEKFTWRSASEQFLNHLAPVNQRHAA